MLLPTLLLAVTLNGKPFPEPVVYRPDIPEPKRVFRITPADDLSAALARLEPGDRLVMAPDDYPGSITIGIEERDGKPGAPIQLLAEPGAVLRPHSAQHGLTIRRSFWYIEGLEIVPGHAKATAVVLRTVDAHDVILNRLHLHDGPTKGISIGSGAHRVTVANSHIHHFSDDSAKRKSFGIKIYSHARDVTLAGNDIHHIGGSGIKIAPPEAPKGRDAGGGPPAHAKGARRKVATEEQEEEDDDEQREIGARPDAPSRDTRTRWGPPPDRKNWSRFISIVGNQIHENEVHAIDLDGYENVRIAQNVLWGHRPRGRSAGEAIRIAADASTIEIEWNHIYDSPVGVRLGTTSPRLEENKPDAITIARNFFQSGAVAVQIDSGRDIRINNNAIDGFATGFAIRNERSNDIEIANNVVARVGSPAFEIASRASIALFDYNVFGGPSATGALVAGETRPLGDWIRSGVMPKTVLAPKLAIAGDLARIEGAAVSDGGTSLRGVEFHGRAPDLGIAEHEPPPKQ